MSTQTPPAGYHTVTPSIVVRDAPRAIDFYRQALGAEEVSRMLAPDGSIMHAEIRVGDSVIMLSEENEQWGTRSPLSTNGNPGSLHVYVPDADAAFQRAVAAGASATYGMEDTFWGDRYGKVRDPFGHEWGFATRIREMTDEEMQKAGEEWMKQAFAQAAHAPEPGASAQ
jgi:PhnB protein